MIISVHQQSNGEGRQLSIEKWKLYAQLLALCYCFKSA